jgi:hypothetical protein
MKLAASSYVHSNVYSFIGLHGALSEKIDFFIVTAAGILIKKNYECDLRKHSFIQVYSTSAVLNVLNT